MAPKTASAAVVAAPRGPAGSAAPSRALARSGVLLLLTRASHKRRKGIRRTLDSSSSASALAAPLRSGELVIASGLAGGLRLAAKTFPLEHVHAHHLLRGTLEIPVQEAFRRHVPAGAVVYDIGANVGFYSLLAARLAGPDGRVYAFEPAPGNAAAVRANAAANYPDRITVLELALGKSPGRAALSIPADSSWAYLERYAPDRSSGATVQVEVATIDRLVADGTVMAPQLVKIDVEGAELDVLAGMKETMRRFQPVIVCEMHGRNAEFVSLAQSLDYRVTNLESPTSVAAADKNTHALAVSLGDGPGRAVTAARTNGT
jgi:FkbM family methyltransferase